MQAAEIEQISQFAQRWLSAGHGKKSEVLDEAVARLGLSRQTLYRKFKAVVQTGTRKRRSDAGTSAVSRDEAATIAATLLEHQRKNGKMQQPLNNTVDILRANGLIDASQIDAETGEVKPVSVSTINRALRNYNMHPSQLLKPAPAVRLASLHPNHVWQIDPSRCVMAYLEKSGKDNGFRVMDEKEFYKNKPANLIKAIKDALWRYVIVDHTSGWIYVEYVLGGETAENITNVLINCMTQRKEEAMHGVPKIIMLDAGSANTSAIFKNLCSSMRIHLQINKPGNPRSKGSVEKGNDIVERQFESFLKTLPASSVQTLDQINQLATSWRTWFNAGEIHTRHGLTRNAAWLRIAQSELIIAPPADLMHELAVTAPESRVVSTFLTVSYKGKEYDVSSVPGVMVGQKLLICRNPSREVSAQAIINERDGNKLYCVLPAVVKNEFGFNVDAPVIGESFKSHADTPASAAVKEIEMLATGTDTLEAAHAARKAKKNGLFDGRYDPLAHMKNTPTATPIPRRGIEHELTNSKSAVVVPPLTHIQAAKQLKEMIGDWSPRHYKWMQDNYPDGIPADAVELAAQAIEAEMSGTNVIPLRRAV